MAAKLQCEICGGKLIGKPGGIFECDSCGVEYSTEWAKEKIQEITGTVKVEGTVEVTGKVQVEGGTVQVDNSANKEALLQRGNLALEDSEWEKAAELFEIVLNMDAQCAEAYLGLAMAEEKCRDKEAFHKAYIDPASQCKNNKRLARARQFGDEKLNKRLQQLDMEAAEVKRKVEKKLRIPRDKRKAASVMIAAGRSHTVGLKADGTVVAVGSNNCGQCDISGWTDVVAVTAGYSHTVGLKADGTVVAVGSNNRGQCDISGWRDIVAVTAGGECTVGLKADGTVVAVGSNNCGQCDISGWRDIVAVAAGGFHTLGLKADGTVVAVGSNNYGQCDISGWTDMVAVAAGNWHTVGLRADGTVVATKYMGDQESYCGQCDVSSCTDIVAIAAGGKDTVGLKADGTVVATGRIRSNDSGWRNLVAVSVGDGHIVGLKTDGTVVAVGWFYLGRCEVSGWKLFDNYETIDLERKSAAEKAEAERKAAADRVEAERKAAEEKRKAKIEALSKEQTTLQTELTNLRGLFTGKRRKEIEERLAEINAELKKLG